MKGESRMTKYQEIKALSDYASKQITEALYLDLMIADKLIVYDNMELTY
jgi:hypothetical protein